LTAAVEQIAQAQLVVRSLEDVVLVDLDHRQSAALSVQRTALPGKFLFFGK
jgi:hypothetical protein